MGSWFAGELAKDQEVAVYDIDPDRMASVDGVRRLKDISDLRSFEPHMLLNCVNLKSTMNVFKKVRPLLGDTCILADIASIKGDLPRYYHMESLPFVSFHPMFGPQFANLDQISGENAIFITESNEEAMNYFVSFMESRGVAIHRYSFEEHDELMSYSLTLPFASSIVFSACVTTQTVPGTTFSRHRSIARKLLTEDDYLLSEVLFNRHSLKQLDTICSQLEFLKHVIKARDFDSAQKFFGRLRRNLGGEQAGSPDQRATSHT
jgi:prephenate dehydrogenase